MQNIVMRQQRAAARQAVRQRDRFDAFSDPEEEWAIEAARRLREELAERASRRLAPEVARVREMLAEAVPGSMVALRELARIATSKRVRDSAQRGVERYDRRR